MKKSEREVGSRRSVRLSWPESSRSVCERERARTAVRKDTSLILFLSVRWVEINLCDH